MKHAPLAMIGFNRPDIQRRTLERVVQADDAACREVFVFIDGPRPGRQDDVENVDKVVAVFEEFRERLPHMMITRRPKNLGCRDNIIASVTDVVNRCGRVIVVEDDILVSRSFFSYLDEALELYETDKRIWCINSYQPLRMKVPRWYKKDVYLTHRFNCFGWGTWADRWNDVDFDLKCWPEFSSKQENLAYMYDCSTALARAVAEQYEKPNTWDVQCSFHLARRGLYSINSIYSLTKNNGSGVGVHSKRFDYVTAKHKYYDFKPLLEKDVKPEPEILETSKYMAVGRPSRLRLAFRKWIGRYSLSDEAVPSILGRVCWRVRRALFHTRFVSWCKDPIVVRRR